jgi:hypothetical protein
MKTTRWLMPRDRIFVMIYHVTNLRDTSGDWGKYTSLTDVKYEE